MYGSFDRLIELFSNRFEPDGDGYVFRANLRAEGIPVSKAERDKFVADYSRRIKISMWASMGLMTALLIGGVVFVVSHDVDVPQYALYVAFTPFILVSVGAMLWLAKAPVRALRGRKPATAGRSKDEARRIAFKRMSWSQLGVASAAFAFLLAREAMDHNLLVGWYRLWLVGGGLMFALVAVQAYRKWRNS